MMSIRIRQLEELNDPTTHVYHDYTTVSNSDCTQATPPPTPQKKKGIPWWSSG